MRVQSIKLPGGWVAGRGVDTSREDHVSMTFNVAAAVVLGSGYPKQNMLVVAATSASPLQRHRSVQSLMQAPSFFISRALSTRLLENGPAS